MKNKLNQIIVTLIIILSSLTAFGGGIIEKQKITISNDFTVVSNAVFKGSVSMSSNVYVGTNRLYLGVDTNAPWIVGMGTTNIQFGAGTNRAIFGAPW